MPVLMFQAFIFATLLVARCFSQRAVTATAIAWSAFSVIMVFMPWLMALQLATIWGSRWMLSSRSADTLPDRSGIWKYVGVGILGLIAAPFLGPFVLAGAVVAWIAWTQRPEPEPSALPAIPLRDVMTDTPHWRAHFMRACESPAETAFLRSMISLHRLEPKDGILSNGRLDLEIQKTIGRYRADFLADGKLVIEIDGAAWHSSPEAVARDRVRDMRAMGYQVVRIPAKTVFRTPWIAVFSVASARGRL